MKRKLIMTGLCIVLAFSITACRSKEAKNVSADKNSTKTESTENKKKNDNSTKSSTEETTVIEVSEEAVATTEEDGSITVKTESGEEIKVQTTDKQEKNADGSVTYTTEDGQKVTIDENTGSTTVTSEIEVPTSSETAPSSETPSGSSGLVETPTEHKHSYTATVTKQPTCTEAGEKTYTCSCGHQYTDVISKTGHNAGDWEVKENATCKKEGTEVRKCTSCEKEMESRAIAKTGHTSSDWIVTKEATETAEGIKVKKCTVCDAVLETASIAKVAHTCNYTWETNGNTRTMKCSCGATKGVTETCYNGYWGYYDSAMATELFNLCNSERQSAQYVEYDAIGNIVYNGNVQAVSRDSSLDSLATSRAVEVLSSWSHNGVTSYYNAENLAKGYNSVFDTVCAWEASHDHCGTMTYQYYTRAGAAWFWYDQDGTGENLIGVAVMEYGE